MTQVIGIKFRGRGKMYYFDPKNTPYTVGDSVVVETAKGLELGEVVRKNCEVEDESVVQPLRPVVRAATEDDLRIEALCHKREKEAFVICKEKIAAHGLDMKLVDVDCAFDGSKIIFFFSSDGRVDFRELVKDLASCFRTRIELRQIGVRDEARMLGGLGICGRAFCCGSFLEDFAPVSTKMAKVQSLSLNPAKISGTCGRLMCCLRYEQEAYEDLVKNVPKTGAFVETPDGYGNATQVNILRQTVKVKLDGSEDSFRTYEAEDVAAVPGGRPRDGSAPAHVLQPREKKKEEPVAADDWVMPQMLAEDVSEKTQMETARPSKYRGGSKKKGSSAKNGKNAAPKSRDGAQKNSAAPQKKTPYPSDKPAATPVTDKPKKPNNHRRYYPRKNNRGGSKPTSAE